MQILNARENLHKVDASLSLRHSSHKPEVIEKLSARAKLHCEDYEMFALKSIKQFDNKRMI